MRQCMSLPREVIPGRVYMLTRRCTQRQHLLRPDDVTNETFLYCLAEAAQRYGIGVVLPVAMSNHHHTVVHDPDGRIIEFTEHFHKMLAKALNAHRGRWENLWSSEPPCLVQLVEVADVMDKLVYVATNPVKAGLVERVHHWPGVHGLSALLKQRTIVARRPRQFFRVGGSMPEEVTMDLSLPPQIEDVIGFLRALDDRVAAEEARLGAERRREGRGVLGRRGVLRQDWRSRPTSQEPRRGLRPRVAARSVWARVEALQRNRAFLDAYRAARAAWLAGLTVVFPAGTYWLRRFARVPVSEPPRA
jgi:REP element-mobilizing transposase RayT